MELKKGMKGCLKDIIQSSTQCRNDHLILKTNQLDITLASFTDIIYDGDAVSIYLK